MARFRFVCDDGEIDKKYDFPFFLAMVSDYTNRMDPVMFMAFIGATIDMYFSDVKDGDKNAEMFVKELEGYMKDVHTEAGMPDV